jgi:NitT/TauT family transport system substrate-binding protein
MMKRTALSLAVVLLAAAASAHAATKVVFLYTAVPSYIGTFVAKDEGMFERRGLDVELTMASTGSVIPAALVANSAQVGAPTPTVLLQANEGGLDLVYFAGCDVYPTQSKTGILARPGSNLQGPRDLPGKKVGVPGLNGIVDVLTRKWIASSGGDVRRVTFVEVNFPQMGDALKNGLVDAVALLDPFYSRIADTGAGVRIGDYSTVVPAGTMPTGYAATREWVQKNPEAVRAYRAALDDAVSFIADPANTAKVKASMARHTRLPPQVADTLPIPTNLTNRPRPESLRFWIDVAREQGMIRGNPDPARLVAP